MTDHIFITQPDYNKLKRLIAARGANGSDVDYLSQLDQELERAEVVEDSRAVAPDVITMNSVVRLVDMDSGEVKTYKLVFPSEARSENTVSILAPIGTAILGYRVGSVIEWRVPKGIRRLKVLDVMFQPEAAKAESGVIAAA